MAAPGRGRFHPPRGVAERVARLRYYVGVDGAELLVERDPGGMRVDGRPLTAQVRWVGPGEALLAAGERSHRVFARRDGSGWRVQVRGRTFDIEVEDERARAIRDLAGQGGGARRIADLRAPMPGLVVRVLVAPGQQVAAGDPLLIVEAMKMENELRAEGAGAVASIEVEAGAAVDRGDLLMTFDDLAAEEA